MVIELPQKMMATSMASLTIKSENPPPPDLGAAEVSLTPSALPEYLARIGRSEAECVVYHDGYRVWTYSYADMARLAGALGARLRAGGVHKGETVMIWSENRPGWVAALWGCLLEGIVVVPVDQQSSIDLFERLRRKVQPRALLLGNHVPEVPDDGRTLILRLADLERDGREAPQGTSASLGSEDIAEIVFTSGTTAEPKGVLISHRNLAASLQPVEDQLSPFRKYYRWFGPLRILNLLPMSHLFGQALGLFLPPLVPASVVFISSLSAQEIARQIRLRRVCALVSVPKGLEVLRDFVVHRFPEAADPSHAGDPWPLRWWRYRAVHRVFGYKFCCFFVGGAPLAAELEQFWANLGFLVVQGYGLTETAPIISFSSPFYVHRGTAGKPLEGVDVKIAEDGEILVRGDNVTRGYFQAPDQTAAAIHDGWFHTGDIGLLNAEGDLVVRGRKKEMIVTPEGLNVFPEDVETVLNRIPGVRDSAVIGTERVHAVLVLDPGADPDQIVRHANDLLEEHQKIRAVSVWTQGELPRTATTRKLRRAQIANLVHQGAATLPAGQETGIATLLRKYAPGRIVTPETTLQELGLSSLDRVELMMDLEEKLDTTIDEGVFATLTKVADLQRPMAPVEETRFPTYNRRWLARLVRRFSLAGILLPLNRAIAHARVSGLANLDGLRGPVIFAANHQSYLDTTSILACLPGRWRYRIAPVMWKEYFDAHFTPRHHSWRERWTNTLLYRLITLLGNAFPIPQTETGARESIRYMGELVDEGWSILIFPEGERTLTGKIGPFLPGVGMIASRLELAVVPIRLTGLDRVLHRTRKWPRPGPVEIRIGAPVIVKGESYAALARQVEEAVRRLA